MGGIPCGCLFVDALMSEWAFFSSSPIVLAFWLEEQSALS